ncbi:hypothetical protein G6F56_010188 [Rhizopus delemar]|nr:hypothetical protein G6F56_010188 [Rhizopus delemar]
MTTQKPTYFIDTFHSEAYEKLFFPEFFIEEEPRNWNTNAYLMQLLQKNPTVTSRNGNKALREDVKIMKAYVIPGTIANTVLRQMEGAFKSAKGKAAISEFWKNSTTIASTSVNYEKSKCQLRGQMAEEVVNEGESRSMKRQRVRATQLFESKGVEGKEDKDKIQVILNNSDEEDDENYVDDIWESWKKLLKSIRESTVLPALSPESHNVIWCGKQVLRRPLLPLELFQELNKRAPNITMQWVDRIFKKLLLEALDTVI